VASAQAVTLGSIMAEITSIRETIKALAERETALRGYL
jgi:hypothetical protein